MVKLKVVKKERNKYNEELPSFLAAIPIKPKEINVKDIRKTKLGMNGPVFFGKCVDYHPEPHSLMLKPNLTHMKMERSNQNLWDGLFKGDGEDKNPLAPRKPFRLIKKRTPPVVTSEHKSPGTRITAERVTHTVRSEFGRTTSIVKGQTIQENLCQIPVNPSLRQSERDHLRMKKRQEMEVRRFALSPQERAAHLHFPKNFVDVKLIGPPIPKSITITQLVKPDVKGKPGVMCHRSDKKQVRLGHGK